MFTEFTNILRNRADAFYILDKISNSSFIQTGYHYVWTIYNIPHIFMMIDCLIG